VQTGGADDLEGARRQLVRFADDVRVLVEREASRRHELEVAYRALSSSYTAMVRTLAETCEAKDTYTRRRLDRTYQYATMLTQRVAPEYP